MSNQRPGKTHRAAASDNGTADMALLQSFRKLRPLVIENDDAMWVIDAIIDELQAGRKLPTDIHGWQRVLGL